MSTPTPAGAGGEEGAAETPSAPPPRQPAKRGRKPNAEKQRILLQQQQEAAARAAAEAEAEADDTPGTPTAKGPGTAASRAGSSSEVAAVGGSSDGTALPGAAGGAGATSSSRQAATNSTSLTSSSNKRERTETTKERKERQKLQRRNLFSKDLPAMMYGFGDDPDPLPETVSIMEEIVVDYLGEVCKEASAHSTNTKKLRMEDLRFALRKPQRAKQLARVNELLLIQDDIARARKNLDFTAAGL